MKRILNSVIKIIKWIVVIVLSLIILFLAVVYIGKGINRITPKGGINETQYVEVNGQEMWISIYGKDINNPVLLYLHGGPGYSTSYADYAILNKLADDYTIVNWDQRSSGRTCLRNPDDDTEITLDLMRSDIDVITDYILDYLGKDKLTVMGISWGSFYGIDFAYNHPEKVECYIGLNQTVGYYKDSVAYSMSVWIRMAQCLKEADFLTQEERELAVRLKLNPIKKVLKGKKIILIDDSIVRGTTSKQLLDLVKEAEPAEIHFLVGCPPVISPCYYGVAMATKKELIAANYSTEEIREQLGVDSLGYITLPALVKAIGMPEENLCLGCVNEKYPTEIPEGLEAETYYKP